MEKTNDQERISKAVKAMVNLRAGKIDSTTLNQYSTRLTREFLPDVIHALEKISELPRGEFETAVPDIATILKLVEVEAVARQNCTEAKKTQCLVRWQCPSCKATLSGFPSKNADLDRFCEKKFWSKDQQQKLTCNQLMNVIFDDNTIKDDLMHWDWTERSGAR